MGKQKKFSRTVRDFNYNILRFFSKVDKKLRIKNRNIAKFDAVLRRFFEKISISKKLGLWIFRAIDSLSVMARKSSVNKTIRRVYAVVKGIIDRQIELVEAKNIERQQLLTLSASITYCLAIIFDILAVRFPFALFELLLITVGIGFFVNSYKNQLMYMYIPIGILWITLGLISGVDFDYKFLNIPISILGYSVGYFITMCMMTVLCIIRRKKYMNKSAYNLIVAMSISVSFIFVVAFLGINGKMNYFNFMNDYLKSIGSVVIFVSRYSPMEFLAMLVVVLSISLQATRNRVVIEENKENI